jgi:hypothetical protein
LEGAKVSKEVKQRIEFWNVDCNGRGMGRGRIENHLQM